MQFVEARDLAVQDVTSTLRHPTHAPLWLRRLVGADVVDEGCLFRDFKVPDVGVTFRAQVHEVDVRIIEGKENTVAGVQGLQDDGFFEVGFASQRVLSLTHAREADREDQSIAQVDGSLGLRSLVSLGFLLQVTHSQSSRRWRESSTHLLQFARVWVVDADLLVLACRDEAASVPTPVTVKDEVWMVDRRDDFAGANVPDDDLAVSSR